MREVSRTHQAIAYYIALLRRRRDRVHLIVEDRKVVAVLEKDICRRERAIFGVFGPWVGTGERLAPRDRRHSDFVITRMAEVSTTVVGNHQSQRIHPAPDTFFVDQCRIPLVVHQRVNGFAVKRIRADDPFVIGRGIEAWIFRGLHHDVARVLYGAECRSDIAKGRSGPMGREQNDVSFRVAEGARWRIGDVLGRTGIFGVFEHHFRFADRLNLNASRRPPEQRNNGTL